MYFRDVDCEHRLPCPNGVCSGCGTVVCHVGVDGCRCSVGWPYDLRCPDCRDAKGRIDDGYCVCVPPKLSPRRQAVATSPDDRSASSARALS